MTILFAADRHGGARPGAALFAEIKGDFDFEFFEDDWSCFERGPLAGRHELVVLNMIAGMSGVAPPGAAAEREVRAYAEAGGSFLLLHGASAAFWPWDWWRPIVGFRWVRPDDPDGAERSVHPRRPYRVARAKCRHPLVARLVEMDLPEDEIYLRLEQTCPTMTLLETTTDEGTFPVCHENATPWGGRVIGFTPGHKPEVARRPELVANVRTLIEYLTQRR